MSFYKITNQCHDPTKYLKMVKCPFAVTSFAGGNAPTDSLTAGRGSSSNTVARAGAIES